MSQVFLCAPLCDALWRTAITKITNRHNNIELVGVRPVYPCMTPPNNADETPVAVLEARMDGRISSMEATFSSFVKLMDERDKVATERHKASEARMDRMEAMIAEIRANLASLRITIVITAVSSVLATVLGVSAFNAALYSNMLAALQTGSDMAESKAEVRRVATEAALLLKRAEEKDAKPKPPPSD